MAREIPLDQIGDYYRESIRILVAATTLEAERRLKKKPLFVLFMRESPRVAAHCATLGSLTLRKAR